MANANLPTRNLSVLHLGAGRYRPSDDTHATFAIWRMLAAETKSYVVLGRSTDRRGAVLREGHLTVHLLPSFINSEAEFLFGQFAALSLARKYRPDVVIAQCPALGGIAAAAVAEMTSAGVLMELHGVHYFARASAFSSDQILQQLARIALPKATAIRALSEGMKRAVADKFGTQVAERVTVLPPRVDLTRFAKSKQSWVLRGRPRVIMVGSVNKRKGQLRFLNATLSSNLDFEVWIVGSGPDVDACRELAVRMNAADRVRMLGTVTHERLAALLLESDVFVMYSSQEGTPRAIMEAMAVGLPVVTTSAGFCADIVEHGAEGFVLGAEPDKEIIARLAALFGDEALRSRLGRAGNRRAVQDFDAAKIYARYRALIGHVADAAAK